MAGRPFVRRLQGRLWEHSPPLRRALRRLRKGLSVGLHRLRHTAGRTEEVRVVSGPARKSAPTSLAAPIVGVVCAPRNLEGQTEVSRTDDPTAITPFQVAADDGFGDLPATHVEAMLMAAAAEGLDWVAAGWAEPAPGLFGPSGAVARDPEAAESAHLLLRRPHETRSRRRPVVGRALPHITSADNCRGLAPLQQPFAVRAGPYRLRPDAAGAAVVSQPWCEVDRMLENLPVVDGGSTVLFLLPFLAVGGAERLLFDLVAGLEGRFRILVATTDPHLASLGQTVDRARELTPHVYTLGDWLPREAVGSAIRHLIRRWKVESLVCWNGSVTFYDEVGAIRRRFPDLRILNQLFNHRGGWIEHYTPSLVGEVDTHIAVNTPIERALVAERGVPTDKVVTIHHAVGDGGSRDEARRSRLRAELGVADDTLVVGTFIRMHPQKRPLDVIRLARRMADDDVHFLLVGGGRLDEAVDRELASDRPPNLTRRPMQPDATPLYDAIDLCLLTSEFEGLPVFLLDGLARGIPCVATAVGDIPLLLRDGGGRVVDRPGDLDAATAAVRAFLDTEHRRHQGEEGRRIVASRFGLDRYVAAYESVIVPSQ